MLYEVITSDSADVEAEGDDRQHDQADPPLGTFAGEPHGQQPDGEYNRTEHEEGFTIIPPDFVSGGCVAALLFEFLPRAFLQFLRITSYNVCYTKLLRKYFEKQSKRNKSSFQIENQILFTCVKYLWPFQPRFRVIWICAMCLVRTCDLCNFFV